MFVVNRGELLVMIVKKTVVSLMAVSALTPLFTSLSAVSTEHVQDVQAAVTATRQSGIVYVKENYTAMLYRDVATKRTAVGKTLGATTAWRYSQIIKVNGVTWYLVGANQWLSSTAATTTPNSVAVSGVAYITAASGIHTYTSPLATRRPNSQVLSYSTAWRVSHRVTVDHVAWYQVGKAAWIPASALRLGSMPVSSLNVTRYIANKAGVALYNSPFSGYRTGRVLSYGTGWKVFAQTTVNHQVWYNVGGSQWILASAMSTTNPKAVTAKSTANTRKMVATAYDPRVLGNTTFGYDTVSANLSVFPRGSHIKITFANGQSKIYVVRDTGTFAAAHPNQLDVAMPNSQALQFGRQTVTVQLLS